MIYLYLWVVFMCGILVTVWASNELDKQRSETNRALEIMQTEIVKMRLEIIGLKTKDKMRDHEEIHKETR